MSILGAVHFATINKALLLQMHMQQTHTRAHTRTCTLTLSLSGSASHLRAALPHCYTVPSLERFSFPNFFLSCFPLQLLPMLGSTQLAACTPKWGRFGCGVDFHQHDMVHNPSCSLLFPASICRSRNYDGRLDHSSELTYQAGWLDTNDFSPAWWGLHHLSALLHPQVVTDAMAGTAITHRWQAAPTFFWNWLFLPPRVLPAFTGIWSQHHTALIVFKSCS